MVVSSLTPPSASEVRRVFFFHDTTSTEIYTLSLHDALPISYRPRLHLLRAARYRQDDGRTHSCAMPRSEEHTSELQSHSDLVCRLLLEKKKTRLTTLSAAR